MLPYFSAYVASAITMLALDAIWLSVMVPRVYKPALGSLLSESPNLAIAGIFYLIYAAGIVVFAVAPSIGGSRLYAMALGAFLGLVAYGTYDFTNLATLRNWPVSLSLIDVAWGVVLTATAATAGSFAASWRF